MKMKQIISLAAASTIFIIGSNSFIANADTWHKGAPKFITDHQVWSSNYRKNTYKGKLIGYQKTLLFFSKEQNDYSNNGFGNYSYNNLNNKSQMTGGNPLGQFTYPEYKKINKNTYLIKGTKYVYEHLDFKLKITKHSSKSISISAKGNYDGFHNWKKFDGTFHPDK